MTARLNSDRFTTSHFVEVESHLTASSHRKEKKKKKKFVKLSLMLSQKKGDSKLIGLLYGHMPGGKATVEEEASRHSANPDMNGLFFFQIKRLYSQHFLKHVVNCVTRRSPVMNHGSTVQTQTKRAGRSTLMLLQVKRDPIFSGMA